MKTLLLDKKDLRKLNKLDFKGTLVLPLREVTANTCRLIIPNKARILMGCKKR